jgi:hypothetical protein
MNNTEIIEAENKVLSAYLDAIKCRWNSLETGDRWKILERLKRIAGVGSHERDFIGAIKIRKKLGLTRKELGKILNISHLTIYHYETHGMRSDRPSQASTKYMDWLKRNGYGQRLEPK